MQTDIIASTHLGKKSSGSETYDPSLLVAIPREENRKQYNIDENNLPFVGYDVWHAYEFSCLTENGIPITAVMKLVYNCDSKYLIESKSLKLYLNSFNMMRYGKTANECLEICKNIIEKDLSEKLQTNVRANFLDKNTKRIEIFNDYKNLMSLINEQSIIVEKFKEAKELLEVENSNEKEYKLTFDSLRSNCRVTHQPDFGDLFIYYKSKKHIKEAGLIKYLASFRSEYHFHEECVEMVFKRLNDILDENDKLMVCALYTRRGGIDICPIRCKGVEINSKLTDIHTFARCGIKQ